MLIQQFLIQWSLHFKTIHSDRKIWSKLKVVLKRTLKEGYYIENIRVVSLMIGLEMEGFLKRRGLRLQGALYCKSRYIHGINIHICEAYTCSLEYNFPSKL